MNRHFLLVSILFFAWLLKAQPIIIGFSPQKAFSGQTVVISGSGFNVTPSQNIVWVGNVACKVNSASTTQLNISIPKGVSNHYVNVLNKANGLSGESNQIFTSLYFGSNTLTGSSFGPFTNFDTNPSPAGIAVGDLDGDGKLDLAVANSGNVSVYRNQSDTGILEQGSFVAKVDFPAGSTYGVEISDMDGDGKLDLVVSNYNGFVVYQNQSSVGTINSQSFVLGYNLSFENEGHQLAVGDLDSDGKPDVAITDRGTKLSVYHNRCITGTITSTSFAPRVVFPTEYWCTKLEIGDIDGDGKPEVASLSDANNNVSVYQNTSTKGTITGASLATRYTYTLPGIGRNLAIKDLDGDNKADLAVLGEYFVAILQNKTPLGIINTSSFTNNLNFPIPRNQNYGFNASDVNGDGRPDLLFAYDASSIGVFLNQSNSGTLVNSSFAPKIDLATGSSANDIALGDFDLDGRQDIAVIRGAGFGQMSVLQNAATISFFPSSGFIGNLVTIKGSSFGSATSVSLNGTPVSFSVVDPYTITATVPANATSGAVLVSNANYTAVGGNFRVLSNPPVITGFNPQKAFPGQTILITGSGFNADPSQNVVWIANVKCKINAATNTQLSILIPPGIGYDRIEVLNKANGLSAKSIGFFNPIFIGANTINGSSFGKPQTFSTSSNIYSTEVGDLDSDEKPDVLLLQSAKFISAFKNVSVISSANGFNFSSSPQFSTGNVNITNAENGFVVTDLDGDGNLDMAAANSVLSLYYNQGVLGVLNNNTFSNKVDLSSFANTPKGIRCADLDGDGKKELIVIEGSSQTISIFFNQSNVGTLTGSSFTSKFDIPLITNAIDVVVGDLNLDGKPEIIVVNSGSGTISIFNNKSSSGTLDVNSFDTKLDFVTCNSPQSIALADLDEDGKLDITIASGTELSILKNNCIFGVIDGNSFAPKVDFKIANVSGLAVADADGDGKPDIAVIDGYNYTSIFRNISSKGVLHNNSLAPLTSFGTNAFNFLKLRDLDGDGRIDILAVDKWGTFTIVKNQNSFTFTPTSSTGSGALVTIQGSYLETAMDVSFDGQPASFTTIGTNFIVASVPVTGKSGRLTVSNQYYTAIGYGFDVKPIPITAATVSGANGFKTVNSGSTLQMVVSSYLPENATASPIWSVSNTNIATINSVTGVLSGQALGVITVTGNFGAFSSSAIISVGGVNIPVVSATITGVGGVSSVSSNKTLQLIATFLPSNANPNPIWSVSNPSLASINSQTGLLTALSIGVVTVTCNFGSLSASKVINITSSDGSKIPQILTGILGKYKLTPNQSIVLGGRVSSNLALKYQIDDETIATVSNGILTGITTGLTTLVVSQIGDDTFLPATSLFVPVLVTTSSPSVTLGISGSDTVALFQETIYSQPNVPGYQYRWNYSGSKLLYISDTSFNLNQIQVYFNDLTTAGEIKSSVYDAEGALLGNFSKAITIINFPASRDLSAVNCATSSDCNDNYINYFRIKNLENSSGCSFGGKSDFTSKGKLDTLLMGNNYTAEIRSNSTSQTSFFGMFIDYNNNGSFADADDFVGSSFEASNNFELKNLVIRNNDAYVGPRRLRISMRSAGKIGQGNGCLTEGEKGETEDYLIYIKAQDALEASPIITPNEDGKNDIFIVRGIDPRFENKLTILDRQGILQFEITNYQNNWRGTQKDLNGKPLEEGTYFYFFSNGERQIKGFVEVKRE